MVDVTHDRIERTDFSGMEMVQKFKAANFG